MDKMIKGIGGLVVVGTVAIVVRGLYLKAEEDVLKELAEQGVEDISESETVECKDA